MHYFYLFHEFAVSPKSERESSGPSEAIRVPSSSCVPYQSFHTPATIPALTGENPREANDRNKRLRQVHGRYELHTCRCCVRPRVGES